MRRKSERQSSRKTKASPEKKIEKPKRTRTSKRKKDSSSSENDSGDEAHTSKIDIPEQVEKKSPTKVQTPIKEDPSDEKQDQVWQVKTEGSSDSGEIQKLKLCLTRPSSTPERADRSPRSKRKSSRTTSSSDTPDFVEEKKKTRHRSKRFDKDSDMLDDETEKQAVVETDTFDNVHTESSKTETCDSDLPMSTSKNEGESESTALVEVSTSSKGNEIQDTEVSESKSSEHENKNNDNETGSTNPENIESTELSMESTTVIEKTQTEIEPPVQETKVETTNLTLDLQGPNSQLNVSTSNDAETKESNTEIKEDKEYNKCDSHDCMIKENECNENNSESDQIDEQKGKKEVSDSTVDIVVFNEMNENKPSQQDTSEVEAKPDINPIETDDSKSHIESEATSTDPIVDKENAKVNLTDDLIEKKTEQFQEIKCDEHQSQSFTTKAKEEENQSTSCNIKELEQSSSNESSNQNGQLGLPVMNRKRRWGARPSKIVTQKSVSISTDILKDIIPDVKPVEFDEVIEEKKQHKRIETVEKIERPILPKIVIDNTEHIEQKKDRFEMEKENYVAKEILPLTNRKISIVKENDSIIARPPSPPRHKTSNVLFITNLVRPFTLPQLKNLLQRTGKIVEGGFWIDKIKSKCYVKYETEDQAVETRHALHGVTWPVSNPKTLHVDFSTEEAFEKARETEETNTVQTSTIPGTVEDWLREQDLKRERGEADETRPWEKRNTVREWDMGKGVVDKQREREKEQRVRRDERVPDRRRHRTPERSPEPAKKFKKKEEEAPAKMLDDLFRKTKTTPCIYWLPLSAEMIAIKEEQRRQHMAEHERRMQELRHARAHRRR
ncbi:Apoptotic chromatin condensation inducer in the nucleus [Eumeta japonica]|uniref:Apoptotic chromatin condensation inducer in the nucleus n=1 Tax=Eumeta variegata TaxID=151549 RepID=A0A4C1ZYS7_EUMVA|nr:Apoptotic chromatin condensation inducer in the nucleus [Eumeta japonica]